MLRSMYSGVSGLKNHQLKMDVIANNIANVNTAGYKASRVSFQEVYSQTLKGATEAVPNARGGTNPQQVGLGVSTASIDVIHTGTGVLRTDILTDLAIQGDGFFAVTDGVDTYYTRAGNFTIDANGDLVNPAGFKLLNTEGDVINLAGFYNKNIDREGAFTGILEDSNDITDIGTIGLARFSNPAGLLKTGENLYQDSLNAGMLTGYYYGGEDGAGVIYSGGLEMSNVDLANEFTEMITTQRGFQANSRVITTSDELLQELVNLKR